jgi:putative transposase
MVDHTRSTWRVSIRRACRALPVERSTYHYRSRRAGQAQLTERIKEIAATRVRYDYRRIHVLLRREGWRVNAKRVYRLYREMGLQIRHKTPKRRVKAKLREDRRPTTRSNETWAMDFVHDQLATGAKLRVLTIIDTFSRFSPADRAAVQLPRR